MKVESFEPKQNLNINHRKQIGFNYQYLLDALKPVKGNVTFSFENSNIQVEISHNRVRNIIMPLKG